MRCPPADLIRKKRDGLELTQAEVQDLVAGVVDGSLADHQLGSLLMAGVWRGASVRETAAWTQAMMRSGLVLDLSAIPGRKVDKHSTGGVGDKVSIPLAPLVSSCGVPVPMVSGRGLGHTGGTVDKLEAIPGFRMQLPPEEFVALVQRVGVAMSAATAHIAPADRRMYATRDITATVESVPWITASILSKKLAEGIDALVMDVKCGRGAFMTDRRRALQLLAAIVRTGRALGKDVAALLTDMDTPLGRTVGNALEVRESIACLRGQGPEDLREVTLALGVEMLLLGRVARSAAQARALLLDALSSGRALQKFADMVAAQGGDLRILEPDGGPLPRATAVVTLAAPRSGFVTDLDPLVIGRAAMRLGAGRVQPGDAVDPAAGIVLLRTVGEPVRKGEPVLELHTSTQALLADALELVRPALRIGAARRRRRPPVLLRVGPRDAPPGRATWLR